MKILFVLEYFYPYIGGSEKLFYQLTQSLAKLGHEVTVITTRFDKTLAKREDVNGVRVIRLNLKNRFMFTFFSLPSIISQAKKVDVIHTTTYNAAFPAYIGARLTGKKLVVTFHEVWGDLWFRLPYLNGLQRRMYFGYEQLMLRLNFDQFVVVSDFTKEALLTNGIEASKVKRIYNGINYKATWTTSGKVEKFTYLYFGRLGVSKGIDLLLVAARVFNSNNDAILRMVIPKKPAKMYHTILKTIERLGIENSVQLYHELSDEELGKVIDDSSCVVIPSYSEGFCFVAAEAVAKGKPIVSSGKGALKEVVSGKYIEMDSQTAPALVDALKRAYQDNWNETPIKKFELSDSVDQYIDNYQQMLSL